MKERLVAIVQRAQEQVLLERIVHFPQRGEEAVALLLERLYDWWQQAL